MVRCSLVVRVAYVPGRVETGEPAMSRAEPVLDRVCFTEVETDGLLASYGLGRHEDGVGTMAAESLSRMAAEASGPTLRVVTSSAAEHQPVVYDRDLPPMRAEWCGFPPLPVLSSSDNWTEIEESGEELVRIDAEFFCTSAQWRRGWPGTSPHSFVRRGVVDALRAARAALPSGLDLAVLDAHRSLETQRYLYERTYSGTGLPAGFVADPEHASIVPPHTTGGAVDVTLTWEGVPFALGCAPGEYVPEANLAALEDGSGTAHELRRVLYWVMSQAGFCGIREEWWHYSIGDQEWAWQRGLVAARYGSVERPG